MADFFNPVVAQLYPDPETYDLIVLSGGTADPMGSDPWIPKPQDFLGTTADCYPQQKIVWVPWGHKAIYVAFGEVVGSMDAAEIGVSRMNTGFRAVGRRTQGFLERHEHDMTFQGHPELNADSAKTLLAATRAYMEVGEAQKTALAKSMESVHDGVWIWGRILFGLGNEPSPE
ncbi:hypothetical protein BGZ57DRAFT_935602 [Hyaloscypha finlandica]|nr:hypothetical protein BGZ57DRAFT_935602 [Hyaloscypha finlandica]